MTRKQKRILIILGVLDFIVIGTLAAIVVRTMSSTPAAPPAVQAQVSPCVQAMLDACNALPAPFQDTATVAWDTKQLYITLSAVYTGETPPPESAQLLWTALDEIATVLQGGCLVPETVTIALTAHGNAETVQYLAQLAGEDLTAWMAGMLPEAELAAQSRFRQTSTSTNLTNR
ncbi:MAG: hypothetical protein ACP5J4_09480 [Anaerolineae bacterium]